jgi:hypothetical protein
VANGPFKVAVRAAFRDYLHDLFQKLLAAGHQAFEFSSQLSVIMSLLGKPL